ncbi:tRNA preQ1(34) S-adenosylmethionine ribosyltransferase-isomerase QueA [Candidatus Woesearchaeota archaeon CG07_land_8_20_14_0_80_44_23]|nr:MAG: tRNA preQ1(34) S-adenosylmethionine ribosyltransferase-isomerase QueA [Candidatus Woesearchaeota archaeon CG07_land_8_20_14_0_80_44_23]
MEREFTLEDFDYGLPKELIAQEHAIPRDQSRLLVVKGDSFEHKHFYDIIDYISPGDVVVINNTQVIPARLAGRKETGGRAEVLLVRKLAGGNWECLVSGRNIKVGSKIIFDKFTAEVEEKNKGKCSLKFSAPIEEVLNSGIMPLPHYIKKKLEDPEMYQTVYSKKKGAIAAPTAGLHFTPELMQKIRDKGAKFVEITLHVSLGTFKPVHDIANHRMDAELYEVSADAADEINNAVKDGHRVFAVGTTVVKTLETVSKNGIVYPKSGPSDIFIKPGYKFKSPVSAMITNFHTPNSTLIMMIAAFGGYERIMAAYKDAIEEKYRFFSFGDSMLLYKRTD